MVCSFDTDDKFGPTVVGCRAAFDFTLYFGQVIVSIIPCEITLLYMPLSVIHLIHQESKTVPSMLPSLKLVY